MTHSVYRLFDEAGSCLYVGCTANLAARVAWHLVHQPWGCRVTITEITEHAAKPDALAEERSEIRRLRPRYNIHGRGLRAGWTQCDYVEYIVASFGHPGRRGGPDGRILRNVIAEFALRFPDTAAAVMPAFQESAA